VNLNFRLRDSFSLLKIQPWIEAICPERITYSKFEFPIAATPDGRANTPLPTHAFTRLKVAPESVCFSFSHGISGPSPITFARSLCTCVREKLRTAEVDG